MRGCGVGVGSCCCAETGKGVGVAIGTGSEFSGKVTGGSVFWGSGGVGSWMP